MTREEALNQLTEVIREEFEDDTIVVSETTTAADIKGWDSLAHLSLMHEVEHEFGIKFTMGEIQGFKNVGEVLDSIQKYVE